jgi:signal peptidase I
MAEVHNYRTGKMVTIKVGDVVGFKSDYEQHGRVTKIEGDRLTLENPDGFGGDYLRYAKTTVERVSDCWID